MKGVVIGVINFLLLWSAVLYLVDNVFSVNQLWGLIRWSFVLIFAVCIIYNLVTIYFLKSKTVETGIIYKVLAKGKLLAVNFYKQVQPFKKEFLFWTYVALGLIFIGFITMGIPGLLFLMIPSKLGIVEELKGENAWPAGIFISLFLPLLFPVAVLVKQQMIKIGYLSFATPAFWGVIISGVFLLVTLMYATFQQTKI